MARKPHRTSRIARLAGLAIAVVGMAFATASWASITSSENPSTDGSYTVSWSWVPNAHAYQLYEDGTLVYDSTGTSWSFSGKAAGDYEYNVGFCEFIFDEEMCYESVYTALTVTVSSAPPPTVSASFDESSITRGEDVTLNWSSTNASACSGSPAIGSTATSGTKTYTPSSAGSFSVTVTCTGDGGSAADSASVTVYEPPTVSASFGESSITLGDDATLSWSSTNASACSGSPSIGSPATSGTKTYTPSSAGSFEVTVTCTGAGGSADDSDSVTVNAPEPPEVTAEFDESSITLGEDATLRWSSTNASACSGSPSIGSPATSGTKTYTPSSAGSFEVTVTCTGAGGSADDSDSVTVNAPEPPEVTAEFDESSITLGEDATLRWSSTNASACSGSPAIGSTATSGTKTYTPSSAGGFSVRVTCTGAGGSDYDIASVTVNPPEPTVRAWFDESSITRGETVTLNWSSTDASACSGSPAIGSTATSGTKTYTPSSAGGFSVRVTCTGAGGSDYDIASVTVNPPEPTVRAWFDESSITRGETVTLNWSSTDASACSGSPAIGSTATSGTKTYTPSSAGGFSVRVTCTGAGGSDYDIASVTVNPPEPTVRAWFDESSITRGETVTLNWSSTDASACSGSPAIGSTATSGTKTYTPSSAGGFSVRVTCTGAGGSDYDIASVTVNPPEPTVRAWFDESSITRGETVTLNWLSTDASACSGSPAIGSTSTSGTKTYTPSSAGGFSVRVTCTGAGGSDYDIASVTVNPPEPTVRAWFDESSITRGESATLRWSSTDATSCSGSRSIGSTATSGSKDYTPSSTGSFSVRVPCTGAGGSDSDSDSVTVKLPAPTLTVPPADTDGSYTVSWTSVSGATSYRLEEKSGSGGFSNIHTGSSRSRNIAGKADGTYSYQVRACNSTCGDWSSTRSVRVGDLTASPNPSSDGSYAVSWSEIFNAESYQLYEDGTLVYDTTGTSRSFSGKAAGTYAYTLDFCELIFDVEFCDQPSGYAELTVTVTPPPAAPTLTVPATDADGTYDATWTSPPGATSYKLREKVGSGGWSTPETLTTTTKNYVGKTPEIYMYEVRACAGSGNCGDWSSTGMTKVPPAAPSLMVPAMDADGGYKVMWSSPSGATSYELQEKSGSGSFGNIYAGSGTSRNITGKTDGTYSYQVRACAGTGNCGDWSSTESVEVSINNAPVAVDDTARTPFGTAVEIAVVDNDTDADGDDLTVTAVTTPANGMATITSDANANDTRVTYTPRSGYSGADTFDYTVSDGTDTASASVRVAVNAPPDAMDDTARTAFDAAVVIDVLANDTDADGDDLTVTAVTTPANGMATITSDANDNDTRVTYTPRSGYSGADTFDYTVSDGTDTASASVRVTVNTPPDAMDDTARTAFDAAVVIDVLANDTDADGDDLTVTAVTTPANGTATITSDANGNDTLVTFTPRSGHSGADAFDYTVSDGTDSATASVRVAVNAPPVAVDDTARTAFDTAKVIDVLANDTDADGDDLTVTVVTAPGSGTVTITSDANGNDTLVTYTPQTGRSGADTFRYTVSDGTDTASASVRVTVNTPPDAMDDTARTAFDAAVVIDVLANDTDAEDDVLTVTAVTTPTSGTAEITSNNTRVTYTPQSGYSGAETFDYTVSDGTATDTGTVSVTVELRPNRAPVAVDDTARTAFDTAKVIDVLANDTDADGDDLTVTAVTTPASGTATITRDAAGNDTLVTYTPQSGHSGADTFDYTVSDGTDSDTGTVSVTVDPPSLEVRAWFDQSSITLGDSVTLTWSSSNASRCGGSPSIGSTATSGTKRYTPSIPGSFSVTVTCTGAGGSLSAGASVSVTPASSVNIVPEANDDTARTAFETAKVIDVLANDTDADGDVLTVTAVTTPTSGTAEITGNDTLVTYTPQSGYSGADTFDYTVSDGTDTDTASVRVTVNTPPVAVDDTARTPFGTAVEVAVLTNDTDADDDDLTVTAVTTPADGTVTITSDAGGNDTRVTYTPQSGYSGADTFDYTVSDGTDTASARVRVTVNTPPVAVDDTAKTPFVTAVEIPVLENDTDADGDDLTVTFVTTPADGTATITSDADGNDTLVTYTPDSGHPGTDTFDYTVSDGTDTDTASVGVTVNTVCDGTDTDTASVGVTVNTPPVAVDDAAETPFETAKVIDVLANDTDADGDDLTVMAVTTPADGTVTVTSDAGGNDTLVTYTPDSGHPGEDTFEYTVFDGTATDTGTVTVTVNRVKVTPNPSTTGSYTLSWDGSALLADRYQVLESGAAGDPPLSSYHLWTSVGYTGKATGKYHYLVERCEEPLGELEECVEYGRATAEVVLPITPGNLPYRSGVTKGGDAYVNVPIAPVPGVNGLAPRLSIDYSGGRERHRADQELPADMIGYGWRVGGFSTIRRCVKGTPDSDGISFDDTDALCLDGEPLTKIKDRHPESPAEYRTARESFAKVVLKDSATGDWFEVHLPDGTVREYGNTADSQLWKPAREASGTDPAEPAAPFLWSINKQTDAFGNVMKYKYYEDRELLARHPKKIVYGDAEDATIEFVYKPRDDLDSTRVGSYFLGQPQRLTYIHLRLGGSLVRDYRLAYERTSAGQVRLNALQTCGYESTGAYHCLSPLEIGWMDAAGGTWVNALTDPMGVATTFTIATLKETDAHDFVLGTHDTPFGATSLPENTQALPAKNGDVKPVVTGVTRSDGIGGTRQTSYAYLGRGVENTRNWGFLGFHAIRETDSTSGIVTYTQYRLDYPYFGRPAQVVRYEGKYVSPTSATRTKTPLSKRSVRYAEKSVSHTSSTVTTTLPHAEETMEWLYEGTSTLGAVRTTETLTLDAGLVDQAVRETRTGHGPAGAGDGGSEWGDGESHTLSVVQRTTRRTLSFDNDETDWVLGFVDDVNVKHYGGDTSGTPDWIETVERTAIENTLAPDVVIRFPNDDIESGDNSEPDDDFEHQTDYDYDSRGNRSDASETASGSTRTWEVLGFSAGRFPTSWRNPLNHTERATHHVGLGVPATTTDANNRRASYAYDGLGRETSRTRHWDSVTTTKDGVTTTEDVKTTTTYASCDDGTCDAVAATVADCGTRYSVAPVMKVTTTAPDMPDSTAHLDMFGRAVRTAVEGFGGVERRVDVFHDARGRTACESEPHHAGETAKYTRYTYDIRDRLTGAARPDGGATGIMYAAATNGVTATVTETVKAANGNQTLATRETKRTHNVLGELVSTTEGAAEAASKRVTTSYAYDGAGRLETVTTGGQTTTFTYDAAGNRASVANPNLGATLTAGDGMVSVKFAHNGFGELTERTDARGATHYGYDELGRRTCAADRHGAATWEYDQTNGTGLLKRRSYDRDTVLTDASCAFGGEFTETYEYNDDAWLKKVTTSIVDDQDPATTTTLTRSHAYDDYGRPSSTTYPAAVAADAVTVTHKYNGRGYPWKLKHGETELVKVTARTAYGQPEAESYGNGVRTRRSYDKLGRLSDIDTIRRGAKIQDNTYAWRSDGSLDRRTARAGSGVRREHFAYDHLNRLKEARTDFPGSSTASRTLTFRYDRHGNLETKTGDVTGYDYDPDLKTNWLKEATIGDVAREFPHDTSGHIERYACKDPDDSDEVDPCDGVDDTFIDWNARGLAEKVTVGESADDTAPTARDSFRYGPDGARYFKKSEWAVTSGTTTTTKTSRKYYAGAYEKTVTVGGDTVERVRIGDSVMHVRTTPASMMATATSAFEYAHRDHLGSVEAVTDASGNELVVLGYDPYGERRKPDWTAQLTKAEIETLLGAHGERVSRGFTRHEHLDRTGLIHMNGRMYDPRLGRFLSPDPIVGDPTSSQSWNLYSYVGNNPLSYVDPTGLYPECDWVCEEDMDAWWDWFDFLNRWWDLPYSGGDYYDSPGDSRDYASIRAAAEQTLRATDQSVADEPADSGVLAAIGEAIRGWWRGILERKHAEIKADCERIHGVGGCEGTLVKDLTPVFGQATELLIPAATANAIVAGTLRTTIRAGASAGHAPRATSDVFRRTPNNLGEQLALGEAKGGAGIKIKVGLKDPKFKGMDKFSHYRRNPGGTTTEIHYVRDPKTGKLMDFKLK